MIPRFDKGKGSTVTELSQFKIYSFTESGDLVLLHFDLQSGHLPTRSNEIKNILLWLEEHGAECISKESNSFLSSVWKMSDDIKVMFLLAWGSYG